LQSHSIIILVKDGISQHRNGFVSGLAARGFAAQDSHH
jgi:hypothetical protein